MRNGNVGSKMSDVILKKHIFNANLVPVKKIYHMVISRAEVILVSLL